MGILNKYTRTLPALPWCFHSKPATCHPAPQHTNRGLKPARLVGSDGRVRLYHRQVSAADLMQEFPQHLICRSDSFYIGQKVPALSPRDLLQPGHSYFLLPSHFFHSVLSFVSLASALLLSSNKKAGAGNTKNNCTKLRPFEIEKTASGTLQIRVRDEFIKEEEGEEEGKSWSRICGTEELEKEYKELVGSRAKQWKPKLETIREYETRKRRGNFFTGLWRRRIEGID
ncbi:uncharacterized protein [Typha angustifolia]|uniref:uncharacterized protein n=1 Tax=Typha angustifolia TaxID=59011 RepID=UPI003C2FCAAD